MQSFVKIKPCELTISLCHLLILVSHGLFATFYVANVSFNAIRENKILSKISEAVHNLDIMRWLGSFKQNIFTAEKGQLCEETWTAI